METIRDALHDSLDRLEALYEDAGRLALSSGIAAVDHALEGLWPGDLVLIVGPPSSAKTSLLIEISRHVALRAGEPTLVLSGEASSGDLAERFVSRGSLVPSQRIRTGRLTEHDWNRITTTVADLSEAPLELIGDCPIELLPLIVDLEARAPELRPRLVTVDSIHHVAVPSPLAASGFGGFAAASNHPTQSQGAHPTSSGRSPSYSVYGAGSVGTGSAAQQLKAIALRCQATVAVSVQVRPSEDPLEALAAGHPDLTAVADSILFVRTDNRGTGCTLDVHAIKRRRGAGRRASAVHVPEVGAVCDVPLDLPES